MTKIGQLDNNSGVREHTLTSGSVTRGNIYRVSGNYLVAMSSATGTDATWLAAEPGQCVWVNKVGAASDRAIAKEGIVYVNPTETGASAYKAGPAAITGAVPIGVCLKAAGTTATEVLVQLFGPRPDRVTIGTGGLADVTGTPGSTTNKLAIMRTVKDFRTVMSKLGMAVAAT